MALRPRLVPLLLPLALVLLAGGAGTAGFPERETIQTITPRALLTHLIDRADANDGPALIDTRAPALYARDHIPGALNIHAARILDEGESLDSYRERGVILYSGNGASARRVALALLLRGHRRVFFLEGTIREWRFAGYPLEVSAQPPPTREAPAGE